VPRQIAHRPGSDRVVEALAGLGGVAPRDVVERRVARGRGVHAARIAVGLAVAVAVGRVEPVVMVDGSPGLALTESDG
jgi:hypothetical protein